MKSNENLLFSISDFWPYSADTKDVKN